MDEEEFFNFIAININLGVKTENLIDNASETRELVQKFLKENSWKKKF